MDAHAWLDEIQLTLDGALAQLGAQMRRPNEVMLQLAHRKAVDADRRLMLVIAARTPSGHFDGAPEDARRLAFRAAARARRIEQTQPKRLRDILGEPAMRPAVEATLSRALKYLTHQQAMRPELAVKAANVAKAAGVSLPAWRKTFQPRLVAARLVRIERGSLGGLWLPREVAHSTG